MRPDFIVCNGELYYPRCEQVHFDLAEPYFKVVEENARLQGQVDRIPGLERTIERLRDTVAWECDQRRYLEKEMDVLRQQVSNQKETIERAQYGLESLRISDAEADQIRKHRIEVLKKIVG